MRILHSLSLLSLLSAAHAVQVDPLFGGIHNSPLDDRPSSDCIPIEPSTACSPWSHGLYINSTALTAVYGLEGATISNSSYWDELVQATTSGGSLQGKIWSEYLQCPYSGEPIQYYRTYVCLTDIFHYSKGCNPSVKALSPSLHADVCDVYAVALKSILKECPDLETLAKEKQYDEGTLSEIYQRRSAVLEAKESCRALLEELKGDGPEVWGQDEDQVTCGFAGNPDIGMKYCDDVFATYGQTPKCCDSIAGYAKHEQPAAPKLHSEEPATKKFAALNAEGVDAGTTQPAAGPDLTGPIAGGVAGGVAFILIAVGAVVAIRRRGSSRTNGKGSRTSLDDESVFAHILTPGKEAGGLERKETRMAPGTRRSVFHEYSADLHDEIDLKVGDIVEIESTFSDGWCRGKNLSTGQVGMFPSGVVEW